MKMKMNYEVAKEYYIEAALHILNHFKTNVMEIHHVGSTSIRSMDVPGDIDILILLKNDAETDYLTQMMEAEGYSEIETFPSSYIRETVLCRTHGGLKINFILMHHESERKKEILYCRDCIDKEEEYQEQFKKLKQAYLEKGIRKEEYQFRKSILFSSIMDRNEDISIV